MSLLRVHSLGVCTSAWASIDQLRHGIALLKSQGHSGPADSRRVEAGPDYTGDTAMMESLDPVSRLAISAITQAWQTAHLDRGVVPSDRIALLFYSAWGQVDSTMAYLESMWADGGRFASPRHFSRSVHSSPTALTAIHFGIHGPCQTLVHDAWPVCSALERADDLLSVGQADAVVVCWADQPASVAVDLCRRAARDLHRPQFSRFSVAPHGGAVAAVVSVNAAVPSTEFGVEIGPAAGGNKRSCTEPMVNQVPYPTDGSLHWAAAGVACSLARPRSETLANIAASSEVPEYWHENAHHGQTRKIAFRRMTPQGPVQARDSGQTTEPHRDPSHG